MAEPSVVHDTFVLERSYSAKPERVFSAFSDPAKKIRWYADGRTMEVVEFTMDFRVGGHDCTRFAADLASGNNLIEEVIDHDTGLGGDRVIVPFDVLP